MVCAGYHVELAPDRTGAEREAIVFELKVLDAVAEKVEAESLPSVGSLEELRELAFTSVTEPSVAPSQGKRNVYQRVGMFAITSWRAPRGNVRDGLPRHFCEGTARPTWSHIICVA